MRGASWCAEGPAGAWSASWWAQTRGQAVVGPWQYQCSLHRLGSTPPRYPPGIPLPCTHPARTPYCRTCTTPRTNGVAAHALTAVLGTTKEILGVDNAQVQHGTSAGTLWLCRHCRHLTP